MLSPDYDPPTTLEDSAAGAALLDLLSELEIEESSDTKSDQAA
jgi:hypothetical protein